MIVFTCKSEQRNDEYPINGVSFVLQRWKERILLNTTLIKCRGKQYSCWLHYNKLNPWLKFIIYLVCNQQTYCYSTFYTLATPLLLLLSLIMWLFCAKLISWRRREVERKELLLHNGSKSSPAVHFAHCQRCKRHGPNAKCAEAPRPAGPAGDNIGTQSCWWALVASSLITCNISQQRSHFNFLIWNA